MKHQTVKKCDMALVFNQNEKENEEKKNTEKEMKETYQNGMLNIVHLAFIIRKNYFDSFVL